MVTKREALWTSLWSSLVVGVAHFIAHRLTSDQPIEDQVRIVGFVVLAATFAVAYFLLTREGVDK